MPFTNPAIYYRTFATREPVTPDPSNLPAAQILEFPSGGDTIIESITDTYQNNVSVDPATNPDGTKKVNLQDNGRLEDIVVVTGKILNTDSAFITKFKQFSYLLQIEPLYHRFGIFGIAYPVTDSFDLDPTNTVGYFIDKLQIATAGQKKNFVSFILTLKTGGTLA